MFVKTEQQVKAQGNEYFHCDGNLRDLAYLTKADGMGFSISDVYCTAGFSETLWYKHHWEVNYIATGRAKLQEASSGREWELLPGTVFVVGPNDRHHFHAIDEIHAISVFNPPLAGDENYDEDGALEPTGPILPGPGRMQVMNTEDLRDAGHEKIVAGGSARSVRVILQEHNVGFTLCDVKLAEGSSNLLWYKNHWEANYVLSGRGKVSDLSTGESWALAPGVMYIVGPEDRHSMEAETDLHLISVFNPPLFGDEQHDAEGTLPPTGPLPPGMK